MFSFSAFIAFTLAYFVVFTFMFATQVNCPEHDFEVYQDQTFETRVHIEAANMGLMDSIMTVVLSLYMPCMSVGMLSYRYHESGHL
jgi:hypothetical protein